MFRSHSTQTRVIYWVDYGWHIWSEDDDVIKWKHFPRYWPFVRVSPRSPVNSPHKGQWHGAFMFSLICIWINDWVNNREAGDLRRYCTHYDVIVIAKSWHENFTDTTVFITLNLGLRSIFSEQCRKVSDMFSSLAAISFTACVRHLGAKSFEKTSLINQHKLIFLHQLLRSIQRN